MNDVRGVVGTVLLFALFFLGPAAVVGAVTAGFVRASATRRRLAPDETHRKAKVGFWIGSIVALALELIVFGWCVATLNRGAFGA